MNDNLFQKGIKYEIYIGLKDKDTYEELLSVDSFKNLLVEICAEKQINFSMFTQLGGYDHNKGYTTETSFRIILIGINEEESILLGAKLKELINTDTILITKKEIEYCFL